MTFTTKIKEEVTKLNNNYIETFNELAAIVRYDGEISSEKITIILENASVARRIYKSIKEIFKINAKIIIRTQKRFRVKTLFILEITEKVLFIKESLYIKEKYLPMLESNEEKTAFFRGAFLACGSTSNPTTNGYHFEMVFKYNKEAVYMLNLLKSLGLNPKKLKRSNKYMVYIKQAEEISDILKMFKAVNCLFEFEDVRIYRDHKNMVNRLNNCEIANQEKTITTGLKQIKQIEYLRKNDLLDLLDESTNLILQYREKYPDVSYQELANIISMETDYQIGKSGINHHFIKVKNLIDKHMKKSNNHVN